MAILAWLHPRRAAADAARCWRCRSCWSESSSSRASSAPARTARNPGLGVILGIVVGLVYAAFLLVLRRGNADLRRPAGPLFDATLVGALASLAIGLPLGEVNLVPSWPAHGVAADAGAHLAGGRLADHQRLAAAAARGADERDPHAPAGRIGAAGDAPARRGAIGDPAAGRRDDPGRAWCWPRSDSAASRDASRSPSRRSARGYGWTDACRLAPAHRSRPTPHAAAV